MAGDWLNWQQFYEANQPEAQREANEEADKNSQASRDFEASMTKAAASGSVDPSAFAAQADASRGQMRQTGMSTPWENSLYNSPSTQLNYGDAWGQLGSRLAGVQSQQQSHERAMHHLDEIRKQQAIQEEKYKAQNTLGQFVDGLKGFYGEHGIAAESRPDPKVEKQWNENNPYERRQGETYAEYSDRISRGG